MVLETPSLIFQSSAFRKSPDVSVIIPAFNHEKFIRETIQSVISQTYSEIELIVVDDGSSDKTLEKSIETAKENDRINISVYSQENQGAHQAINFGISRSSGEFTTILNSDDLYVPQRIETLRFALSASDSRLAFSRIRCINEESLDTTGSNPVAADFIRKQNEYLNFPSIGFALLDYNIAITTGNLFFERRLFDQIGGFRRYRYCHDWDFILSSLQYSEPLFLMNELYQYRLHSENTFLQLEDIADQEVKEILECFFKIYQSFEIFTPQFPSKANFGDEYDQFIRNHGYRKYLP